MWILRYRIGDREYRSSPGIEDQILAESRYVRANVPGAHAIVVITVR